MDGDTENSPCWDQYCDDNHIAGSFVNRVLYKMCRDYPGHDDLTVTAGKIDVIGRIYAASPERGSGTTGKVPVTVVQAIATRLANSDLDGRIGKIDFSARLSSALLGQITDLHTFFVEEVFEATKGWMKVDEGSEPKPRRHHSFASKYLHFHRPNAFPMMDKHARAGLTMCGIHGANNGYASFCDAFLEYANQTKVPDWTPRSLDNLLHRIGREGAGPG